MIVRVVKGAANARELIDVDGPLVMIDALRMSATLIVALARGMTVVPVSAPEQALSLKRTSLGDCVITAGERDGWKIPSLDLGNSPSLLLRHPLPQRTCFLALTTTNGSPSLLSVVEHPGEILIGSPLNISALVTEIRQQSSSQLGILIAGRKDDEAQEDAMSASLLLKQLDVPLPSCLPAPVSPAELPDFFARTPSGRRLIARGREDDVRLCASVDRYPLVALFKDGRVIAAKIR